MQRWRRAQRENALFVNCPGEDDTPDNWPDFDSADPRDALLRREEADDFFALVETLPAAQRSALLLHVLEDFSLEEIARISGVPVGTVKSRLHHAKRALREKLETRP